MEPLKQLALVLFYAVSIAGFYAWGGCEAIRRMPREHTTFSTNIYYTPEPLKATPLNVEAEKVQDRIDEANWRHEKWMRDIADKQARGLRAAATEMLNKIILDLRKECAAHTNTIAVLLSDVEELNVRLRGAQWANSVHLTTIFEGGEKYKELKERVAVLEAWKAKHEEECWKKPKQDWSIPPGYFQFTNWQSLPAITNRGWSTNTYLTNLIVPGNGIIITPSGSNIITIEGKWGNITNIHTLELP